MLILSRKKSECIVVTVPPSSAPTEITVAVTDIRGDKVRLGFNAPKDSTINRAEVEHAKATGKYINGLIRLVADLRGADGTVAPAGEYPVHRVQGMLCVKLRGKFLAVNDGDFEWVEQPLYGRGA